MINNYKKMFEIFWDSPLDFRTTALQSCIHFPFFSRHSELRLTERTERWRSKDFPSFFIEDSKKSFFHILGWPQTTMKALSMVGRLQFLSALSEKRKQLEIWRRHRRLKEWRVSIEFVASHCIHFCSVTLIVVIQPYDDKCAFFFLILLYLGSLITYCFDATLFMWDAVFE